MEYFDNLISSPEDFTKMAKEYTSRLKRERLFSASLSQVEISSVDTICLSLKNLNSLYSYIKKKVNTTRARQLFLYLEEECRADLEDIEKKFVSAKIQKSNNHKKIKNFQFSLKSAISNEAELIQKLNVLTKYQNCEFIIDLSNKHLDFIKSLCKF
ncbi:MAG: hypothetical protein PHS54_07020 [Clostridia bacterium]|nr:hypothetical protein [Clostridia bacterium]